MPKIIYKQRHVDDNSKRKFSASRNSHYALYIGSREHVLKKSSDERSDEKYNESREHMARLAKYMGEREHVARKNIDKKAEEKGHEKIIVSDRQTDEELLAEDERQYNEQMNDERDNGLFGYIGGVFSDEYNMRDVQSYIRRISGEHNVFHSIYSFTPESAAQAGLNSLDDWENWVKYHINEIARAMNMKIEDIEYVAAVHLKEGQPHVHIEWWNKEQQIFINKVDPLVCDAIRIAAMKSTFRGEFTEIHNREDALIKELRGMISGQTNSMLTALVPGDYTEAIAKALNHIGDILPKHGQLAYGYLPADIKAELDKLTHYIIDNNPQFSQVYENALDLRRLYNEMLHSADGFDGEKSSNWSKYKLAKYMGRLNDDIEKAVGNTLLKIIKRERKAGRQRFFDALDSVPIPDEPHREFNSKHWMEKSQRETFDEDDRVNADDSKRYIRWSDKFKAAREAAKSGDHDKAFKLYSEEAKSGNALAEYEIADMYRRGLINGEDKSDKHYSAALAGFLKLEQTAEKMKPYLQYRIGRMYYDGYGTEQDFTEALKWLESSARGGNHLSEYAVAKMYRDGKGTECDPEKAFVWFNKAADSGNAYANYEVAKMYKYGQVAPQNADEAERYFKAAYAGFEKMDNGGQADDNLWYKLGYMTQRGIGCEKDPIKAAAYLKKSADRDNIYAMYEYGKMLIDGKEIPQNVADGLRLIEKCVERNDNAKYYLGRLYMIGEVVPRDMEKATALLNECEDNPFAEYALGKIHYSGNEIRTDYREAEKHLLRAAAEGLDSAELMLGKIYISDDKNMRNVNRAVKWFTKAAEHGYADGAYRLSVIFSDESDVYRYDNEKAQYWLSRATEMYKAKAESGDHFAALSLGKIYADKSCSAYDTELAEKWLKLAAESDDECSRLAEYPLAKLYMSEDVKRYEDAVKWLKISFSHENNNAAFALAKIYSDEDTGMPDFESAKEWLEKAETGAVKNLISELSEQSVDTNGNSLSEWLDSAEQALDISGRYYSLDKTDVTEAFMQQAQESRLSEAEYKLGMLFLKEENLNYELAEKHLRRAAALRNPYAMYSLAKLYLKGDIPKDYETAFRLLNCAKELDESISPLADYTMGAAYMFDEDIRDRELAEKYLTLSAQAGNEYAQNLLDKADAWRRNNITDLLRTVYNILETNSRDGEESLSGAASAIFGRGDLSKEAIAELIYKLQDKQNTAEM